MSMTLSVSIMCYSSLLHVECKKPHMGLRCIQEVKYQIYIENGFCERIYYLGF